MSRAIQRLAALPFGITALPGTGTRITSGPKNASRSALSNHFASRDAAAAISLGSPRLSASRIRRDLSAVGDGPSFE